jgi:hypothetical protein
MIDVFVDGGNKLQRKYVQSIAEFSLMKLMPKKKNLFVEIQIKKLDCVEKGLCLNIDRDSYSIEIDSKQSMRRLLETVAHEMVHVKQYSRGELTELKTNQTKWQGKVINRKSIDYYDLPWEIEAYGREVGLFIRWAEDNELANEEWTQDLS